MNKIIKDYKNYEIGENGNVYNILTQKSSKGSIGENKSHDGFIFKYEFNNNFNDYPEIASEE